MQQNKIHLLEVHALQALLYDLQGKGEAAVESLKKSL